MWQSLLQSLGRGPVQKYLYWTDWVFREFSAPVPLICSSLRTSSFLSCYLSSKSVYSCFSLQFGDSHILCCCRAPPRLTIVWLTLPVCFEFKQFRRHVTSRPTTSSCRRCKEKHTSTTDKYSPTVLYHNITYFFLLFINTWSTFNISCYQIQTKKWLG
jgi:hypothetical protein